jgi:ADP-dependent NAD(P)H-hydrate dehydratase
MTDRHNSPAPIPLDSAWIAANPAPVHQAGTTKNSRGRVLAVGGSLGVPGGLRLTGEAALRVGAGKLQMATVASAALPMGMLVPEAGVIALPEDEEGEIGAGAAAKLEKAVKSCDALVFGPAIGAPEAAERLLRDVVAMPCDDLVLVLDAMAIGCAKGLRTELARFRGRLVLTPHHGEMAVLTGEDEEAIVDRAAAIAGRVAQDYGAVVVLKGSDTVIATPDGGLLHYGGGGTGLATGGSGDVLAGAIAGLVSRGAEPLVAAGWGVWLHGQSGRRVATTRGPIGFLAREVPAEFPRLLPQ